MTPQPTAIPIATLWDSRGRRPLVLAVIRTAEHAGWTSVRTYPVHINTTPTRKGHAHYVIEGIPPTQAPTTYPVPRRRVGVNTRTHLL